MPGFSTRAIRAASRAPDAPQPPINVPIYQTSTFEVTDAVELAELLEFQRPGHSYSRLLESHPRGARERPCRARGCRGGAGDRVGDGGDPRRRAVAPALGRRARSCRAPCTAAWSASSARSWIDPGSAIRRSTRPIRSWSRPPSTIARGSLWLETISNPTTAVADIADPGGTRPRPRRPAGRGQHVRLAGPRQSAGARRRPRRPFDHQVHRRPLRPHGWGAGRRDRPRRRCPAHRHQCRRQRRPVRGLPGAARPEDARAAHGAPLGERAGRGDRAGGRARRRARPVSRAAPRIPSTSSPCGRSAMAWPAACSPSSSRAAAATASASWSGSASPFTPPAWGASRRWSAIRPARRHRQLDDAALAAAGMSPGTVRVSIGLEDAEDLIEDLVGAARPGT